MCLFDLSYITVLIVFNISGKTNLENDGTELMLLAGRSGCGLDILNFYV